MKKNKGILSLILTAVLVVLLGFTVLVGLGETGTGAMKNIKLGLDLKGGVSITYQVKDDIWAQSPCAAAPIPYHTLHCRARFR